MRDQAPPPFSAKEALTVIQRLETKVAKLEQREREPIAIVGMGCRFPGGVDTIQRFWRLLVEGRDASSEIPADRWDVDHFFDPDPAHPGTANCKRGSFLGDVRGFSPSFFEISPREAEAMDPQQRILLEVAWEAIEDSGLRISDITKTGVFVGACASDYAQRLRSDHEQLPPSAQAFAASGSAASILANRISYVFGFEGPSLTVDTACSSSLVAVDLACENLRKRSADVALAAGVNLMLSPASHVVFSQARMLAPDGRSKSFDARADGFGRGEGCGVVVLKRLSDAVANGDRIWAVIRGAAVNHVGRTPGLTVPTPDAEEHVMRRALANARVGVNEVQYVEAHGTGTVLGDPIEIEAIGRVVRPDSGKVAVGSVKTNVGHLEGAAGMPGLIKTALSIWHRKLPATLHFVTPNPHIPFDELPLRVQAELGPWPNPEKPLIAGVSSFGFGGALAHVVVGEAPATSAEAWKQADRLAGEAKLLPLCISAKTPEALRAYAARYAEYLSATAEDSETWRDIAYTSCVRATHLKDRLVVVSSSRSEWASALDSFAKGTTHRDALTGEAPDRRSRPVFVFSGQGPQWWGMGRELIERGGVFRETIEECSRYVEKYAGWSLLEELGRDESASRLHQTDIVQPALVAIQMGLVRLLASWGVEPSAVVGHSVGEIAAACTAGVLTLEQACQVAVVRGRVMHKGSGLGKMMSVRLPAERAEAVERDMAGRVVVAGYNAPESVVLSGDAEAMERVREMLASQGVETKDLKVDYAFHSPQMEPFMAELGTGLRGIEPAEARLPLVSTVTGAEGARFDEAYWVRQMRAPVRFAQATQQLLSREYDLFVELGPHPVLLASIDQTASHHSKPTTLVPTLRRKDDQERCAFEALGALHNAGHEVDWAKLFSVRGRVVSLPSYPWQREAYWLSTSRGAGGRSDSPWTLIHRHYASSDQPGKHVFEVELDTSDGKLAYLADHKVQGGVWLPGAAFAEMALEAASVAFVGKAASVDGLTLSEALTLTEGEPVLVQVVVQPEQQGSYSFRIASRAVAAEKEPDAPWVAHASGRLTIGVERGNAPRITLSELQKRCGREVGVSALYEEFAAAGLPYGPAFQGIEQAWSGDGEALSKLVALEKLTEHVSGYVVHPSLLDAAFQTTAVAMRGTSSGRTYVPATVEQLRVHGKAVPRWAHVTLRSATEEAVTADVTLLDDKGRVAVEVIGLRALALGSGRDKLDDWLFEVAWRSSTSKTAETVDGQWLLLADEQGIARELRRWLEARGASVVSVTRGKTFTKKGAADYEVDALDPASMLRLMKEAFGKVGPKHVVSLFALDTRATSQSPLVDEVLQRAQELTCTSTLHLVQALAQMGWSEPPRLYVVTRGCQPARESRDVAFPEQALAWGFGATIAHEMTELHPTLIDLEKDSTAEALGRELAGADNETRVALRGSERLVARLARHVRPKAAPGALRPLTVGAEGGYALDATEPGRLDSLTLRPAMIPTPGRGQVVIRTRATGLSFRDVQIVLGTSPGLPEGRLPMGGEFAGVVDAVGEGVTTLRVGDEVAGLGAHGFDAFTVTDAQVVVKKPASLTFEQAASLPSAAMILYALERVGRLRKGERILIHAATGGAGLAAVQYAKHVGAEIYATAGSEEKRAYLRSLGVAHVYDSRALSWAEEVKRDTDNRGVDVVLNSLSGEALLEGVSVLAPFGRFLEIGNRDIFENGALGIYGIRNNVTVSAVALEQLVVNRPAESGALLEETFRLVESGVLSPLRVEPFPVSRALDAFEHLASERHIGKVVITAEETVVVRDGSRSDQILQDKTYLVTGGLGGLGLVVAKRLAKLGAKHLALMGRSAPSESALETIRRLRGDGVNVHVVRADVSQASSLKEAVAVLADKAPPVHGVIHTAGVLADATLANLTTAQVDAVLAPKVRGTLALEHAFPGMGLRVYFASFAGVAGSGGQAHYAAANAFLDAFAHHQVGRSERALSLDWGAWGEVGLAARSDRSANVVEQGLTLLSPDDGAELFERLLPSSSAQVLPMAVDLRKWRQASSPLSSVPLFSELVGTTPARRNVGLFDRLAAAFSDAERLALIEEYLRTAISGVTRSSPASIGRSVPFKQLGFDSLMTVSLKNTLERDLGMAISTSTLFAHPSVDRLAVYIATKADVLGGQEAQAPKEEAGTEAPSAAAVDEESLDSASIEELRRLVYGQ